MSTLHDRPSPPGAPTAIRGRVVIERVAKRYDEADEPVVALREVSLVLERGEFVSVLGPSGCGKSTLLLLVAGLEPVTSGSITIGDAVVKAPVTDVGVVFQEHGLYDWRTVLDNVLLQGEFRALPRAVLEPQARELLRRTGLADFAGKYPGELSGGMRQRASICRALVHNPPLLLFDEPFGALDALTRMQMQIDLEKLWLEQRQTVLFITHSISEAVALSDRVVIMSPRPGQVDTIIPIDLPRPRDKAVVGGSRFTHYCDEITQRFMARGIITY